MKTLKLRGLNGKYVKVNKGKHEVYFNKESNNMIIFDPIDKQCDTYSICNGISEDAYINLIEYLNEGMSIAVHWSQIEMTTSDYTIYMDWGLDPSEIKDKSVDDILAVLNDLVLDDRLTRYKYTFVLDKIENAITFDRNVDEKDKRKGRYIDHINCDKWDNRIENLRLV